MKSNRILYLSVLIAAFLFANFYGGKIPYIFLNVVLVMPLVSLFYTLLLYFCFRYAQDIDSKFIIKGDRIKFSIDMKNWSPLFYPNIKIVFCGLNTPSSQQTQTRSLSLLPFSTETAVFEMECNYRGCYNLELKSVEFQDFLGIIKLKKKRNKSSLIIVHPRVIFLDRLSGRNGFHIQELFISNKRTDDMAMVSDVRKYAMGDPFKKIHWKLTAKTSEIMVKNFEKSAEARTILLLDLRKNNLAADQNIILEDKVIESAAAVSHYCLSKRIPIDFIYHADRIMCTGAEDLMGFNEIYKALSVVEFNINSDIGQALEFCTKEKQRMANIIIFTSNVNQDLYNKIYEVKHFGYEMSMVYVSCSDIAGESGMETQNILAELQAIDVQTCRINAGEEIKAVLEKMAI